MAFPEHNFDLSDMPFTPKELDDARTFWIATIQELDPSWLKKPKGELGRYWLDNSHQAMTYLILLSKVLESLVESITEGSKRELRDKVKQLLRLEAEQYISLITELLAMQILSQKLTPLKLNAHVGNALKSGKTRARKNAEVTETRL